MNIPVFHEGKQVGFILREYGLWFVGEVKTRKGPVQRTGGEKYNVLDITYFDSAGLAAKQVRLWANEL